MLLKEKKNQNISFIQKENKIKQRAFFPSMTSFAQENINILPKINWLAAKRISYESANSHGPNSQATTNNFTWDLKQEEFKKRENYPYFAQSAWRAPNGNQNQNASSMQQVHMVS